MQCNLIRFATAAAIAAGLAFAQTPARPPQPPAEHRMAGPGEFHERMMQQLNLSETQKQEAKAIFEQARTAAKPVREELMQNREALHAAIKANDTARIHTLAAKQGDLRAKIVEIRADAMAKFYTKLTPEQRTKADQLHQEMRQRWEQRKTPGTRE